LILTLYFALLYHPLSKRAASLDTPLTEVWRKLAATTLEVNATSAQDLPRIDQALQQVQASLSSLDKAQRVMAERIALESAVRARMQEPFQLIDFQNERQLRIEELDRLAKQQQVKLEPAVLNGFPEYTADTKQAALLWAQLAIARELVSGAIHFKVTTVRSLRLPAGQSYAASGQNEEYLDEVPVDIALTGSMASVSRFLLSLPLRADEAKALGLSEASSTKPTLFIDRILLRKASREKPDEVNLDLRACGFVYRH
jgi:hypothetical protein